MLIIYIRPGGRVFNVHFDCDIDEMLTYLLGILMILGILHGFLNYNKKARMMNSIPGPKGMFLVGNAINILKSPVELFAMTRDNAKRWKSIYKFWSYPLAAVSIFTPEDIEVVISSTKFNQKSILYNFIKPWLKNGLLVSYGDTWLSRRKILTPAFHFNVLRRFCNVFEDNSIRAVEILRKYNGEPVDIVPVISEATLHAICETAMGTKLSSKDTKNITYKEAIYEIGNLIVQRISRTYLYLDFIFNLSSIGRLQRKYLNILHKFTKDVIIQRKEYIEIHGSVDVDDDEGIYFRKKGIAMLDLLISAQKEGKIDDDGIHEEVDTFMFEGHDTTASGLTYCLLLLANHQEIQGKILKELNEIFGDTDRSATIEDMSKMKYLERCIKESLRLYPPVPLIGRYLDHPVVLSGYQVPAKTYCQIHIYDLHRREDLYKNPLAFDPDRFLPENLLGRHPYAYLPFSAGPRNCIGQKFALLEMKSIISRIIREFELKPITQEKDLIFVADLVLRTTVPVYVSFVPRKP